MIIGWMSTESKIWIKGVIRGWGLMFWGRILGKVRYFMDYVVIFRLGLM